MTDYYSVLNIARNATENDIKKAYRRLALQWHPDKNLNNSAEASTRFREISDAYQVLSRKKKRRAYDNMLKNAMSGDSIQGATSVQQGGCNTYVPNNSNLPEFAFRSPQEIFENFFGTNSPCTNASCRLEHYPNNNVEQYSPVNSAGRDNLARLASAQQTGRVPRSIMSILMSPQNISPSTFYNSSIQRLPGTGTTVATSTSLINGKKLMTKRILQRGVETVYLFENDILVSKSINGIPQVLPM